MTCIAKLRPIIILLMRMFIMLWQGHCRSSLGSFNECRLSAKWQPSLRLSQLTWAVSLPVGCHHLHSPSPFIIITQPKGWFYCPTEGTRLSRLKWLATCWGNLPTQHRATMLVETNALLLSQVTCCCEFFLVIRLSTCELYCRDPLLHLLQTNTEMQTNIWWNVYNL